MRKKYSNYIRYLENGIWKEKQVDTYDSAKWFCKLYEKNHGNLSCRIRREEKLIDFGENLRKEKHD